MLVFPVSKLLDCRKLPAEESNDLAAIDSSLPYVRLTQPPQQLVPDVPGVTEVHLEVVSPKPCWGTLKLSTSNAGGHGISSWSIKPGEWHEADSFLSKQHSGSGSVMVGSTTHSSGSVGSSNGTVSSLIIKFTNEHQQEALHWPVGLRLLGVQAPDTAANDVGLRAELHVGYIDAAPQLTAVEQHMPAWSTLSYHAIIMVGTFDF